MAGRGTIGRFARWGLRHGPLWGAAAALLMLPLSTLAGFPGESLSLAAAALLAGLAGGPLLGVLVGGVCLAADRAPKWLLDAPDYVAALTVIAVVGVVAWPVLGLGKAGLVAGALALIVLCVAPAVDAANSAPDLLHPPRRT
jgi:hypothetical protein